MCYAYDNIEWPNGYKKKKIHRSYLYECSYEEAWLYHYSDLVS